ncbi:MAG: hypothetical protein KGJ44_08580 [Betaproteobacteria bacterium]|nr:hypothetical protein [Betaproteobacteria bacterium]
MKPFGKSNTLIVFALAVSVTCLIVDIWLASDACSLFLFMRSGALVGLAGVIVEYRYWRNKFQESLKRQMKLKAPEGAQEYSQSPQSTKPISLQHIASDMGALLESVQIIASEVKDDSDQIALRKTAHWCIVGGTLIWAFGDLIVRAVHIVAWSPVVPVFTCGS